ncbi:MAG: hypothetical protein ACFE9S_13355 [Candidatus Hermodarchaeota archaeon]
MTGQIPDEVIFNDESFSIVGLKGQGLYKPEDFGINPYFSCTACWRGYVMKYILIKNHLILDELLVNVHEPVKINGVKPEQGNKMFKYEYKNLKLKTNFTGRILLAKDFIDYMYVHMGFQRPIAFKTVLGLEFENGELFLFHDLSKEMEERRIKDPYRGAQPNSKSAKDIENWIEKTFSLDFD